MTAFLSGVRVWLATGHTDMRRGFNSFAIQVHETLQYDPHGGNVFVFRGKRGDSIKLLWHDGPGECLFAKRLERGRFIWPAVVETRWRSRRPNSAICSRASIGERHDRPGAHRRRADVAEWNADQIRVISSLPA